MYFLKSFRPSSVGAEKAKSARLITMPKKKFVLKRNRVAFSLRLSFLTERNRVVSWRCEHADDPDGPKCVRCRTTSCSLRSHCRFAFRSSNPKREPAERTSWRGEETRVLRYSMNDVREAIAENDVGAIFDVEIRLWKRERKRKDDRVKGKKSNTQINQQQQQQLNKFRT